MSTIIRTLFLSFLLMSLNLDAQVVSNPIGSEGPIRNIEAWKDNLIISGSSTVFGRTLLGFDTVHSITGKLSTGKVAINGIIRSSKLNDDGSYFLLGEGIVVNGVSCSSQLVFVDSNGIPDTTFKFNVKYIDEPNYKREGWISSLACFGDTLFISGRFRSINGFSRNGVAAILKSTRQILDWDLDLTSATENHLILKDTLLYVHGTFTEVNKTFHPNSVLISANNLKIIEAPCFDGPTRGVEVDSDNLYIYGDFLQAGTPVGNGMLTNSNKLSSLRIPPILYAKLNSPEISTMVRDNNGGYFFGGRFNQTGDSLMHGLIYVDSANNVSKVELEYDLDIAYHLDCFNDTLLIVASSPDTLQSIHYFSLNSWKQIGCPIQCSIGNVQYSSYKSYDNDHFIISGVNQINGISIFGNALINKHSGKYQWLPASGSFLNSGDTIYFTPNSSYNHSGYSTGPITNLTLGDSIPNIVNTLPGSANVIISDNLGGHYVAGNIGASSEKIVHLNADGTEDQQFNFKLFKSSSVHDLVLIGDTLFVAGDFLGTNNISTGNLILIDVKNKKLIRNVINVKGDIYDLELINDTLFLAGSFTQINSNTSYHQLAAINTRTLTPYSWNPSVNGDVTCLASGPRHIYAAGQFDSIGNSEKKYICALNRKSLTLDSALKFNVLPASSVKPIFNVLKYNNNHLYIGGKLFPLKYNNQYLRGLAQLNIQSGKVNDLNLFSNSYTTINDLSFLNDTLFLAGNFTSIRGENQKYFSGIDLKDTSVIIHAPQPDAIVNGIFISDRKLWLAGDFTKFGDYKGDYLKYKVSTKSFLPSPDHNLFSPLGRIVRIKNNLFCTGSRRVIDGFTHNSLYKYVLSNDSLVQWNAHIVNKNPNLKISHIVNYHDTLCAAVQNYLPEKNKGLVDNVNTFVSLDLDSGKVMIENTFDGFIRYVNVSKSDLFIGGGFNYMNYLKTKVSKVSKDGFDLDYSFKSGLGLAKMKLGSKQIWGLGSFLYRINRNTGADTQFLYTFKSGEQFNNFELFDTTILLYGSFSKIRYLKKLTSPSVELDFQKAMEINLNSLEMRQSPLRFNTWPKISRIDSSYLVYPVYHTNQALLYDTINSSPLVMYNVQTDSLTPLYFGRYTENDIISKVKNDKLYIANANAYFNNKVHKGILEFDLLTKKTIREIPNTKRCYDFKFYKNQIIQAGDFYDYYDGLRIVNLNNNQIIPTPKFNDDVNSIYIKDSIAYLGGDFSKVDNQSKHGLVKLNLNTFKINPFKIPFSSNCKVKHLNGKNDLLFISGRNVKIGSGPWESFSILDLNSETSYLNTPKVSYSDVQSSFLVNDLLFINELKYLRTGSKLKSWTYNLQSGLRDTRLDSFQIYALNGIPHKKELWLYGGGFNPTFRDKGHIGRLSAGFIFQSLTVNNYTPKIMAKNKSAKMTLSGYGFNSSTKFWLQNSSDTLYPIDSTIVTDDHGFLMSAMFSNVKGKLGRYDLVVNQPADTSILIPKAVLIEDSKFGGIEVNISGRDTIRPEIWSSYNIQLKNNSNYDYQSVPLFITIKGAEGIKVREQVAGGDSLVFDSENLSFPVDSLNGDTFNGKMVSLLIPNVSSNSITTVTIGLKGKIGAQDIALSSFIHSPILGVEHPNDLSKAYSEVLNISKSCIDSSINDLYQLNLKYNSLNISRKPPVVNYRWWIERAINTCNSTDSIEKIFKRLIPKLYSPAKEYSGNGSDSLCYNGKLSFTDTITSFKTINLVNSLDPNIKIGFRGVGPGNFTQEIPLMLNYSIHFENDSTATAPVQELIITDSLDMSVLNPSSVIFKALSLGDNIIQFNSLSKEINTVYRLNESDEYFIHVTASVDTSTGVLICNIKALDNKTGLKEDLDPFDGFLPPHRNGENGNGYLSFFIDRYKNASTIKNKAAIVFDNNPPIKTPIWEISKDLVAPMSQVSAVVKTSKDIELTLSGNDNKGSGLKHYDIYYSLDDVTYLKLVSESLKLCLSSHYQ